MASSVQVAEQIFDALAKKDYAHLLSEVKAQRSVPLAKYCEGWIDRIGKELRADVNDTITNFDACFQVGEESADWELQVRALAKDGGAANTLILTARDVESFDEEVAPTVRAPTFSAADELDGDLKPYTMLLAPRQRIVYLISGQSDLLKRGYRALAFDANTFAPANVPVPGPKTKTVTKYKCIEIGTALSAIFRVQALMNLGNLDSNLRSLLIPGEESRYDDSIQPWMKKDFVGEPKFMLNPGQQVALDGVSGSITVVQGPPGTGKSSFISEAFLRRIPPSAKVLVCTSTNKAIDSLVSKLEDAGVTEMITVGSPERMGSKACHYLISERLDRDPALMKAEASLAKATNNRETCQQIVERLAKPQRPKKAKDGTEQNRGFVERQFNKLKQDLKNLKKTPGIVRLMGILGPEITVSIRTNKDLYEAAKLYLEVPAELEDAQLYEERSKAKKALEDAIKTEVELVDRFDEMKAQAARTTFRKARIVACTASSAVHVVRRLNSAVKENSDGGDEHGEVSVDLPYVVLDEAGAMLEPDAIGCLLHGAKALLLVGDHHQLPPFSKWDGASDAKYNVSLMERLSRRKSKKIPSFMLKEQYRMHSSLGDIISSTFYNSKLTTAASTKEARTNPLPCCFLNQTDGREEKARGATSWQNPTEVDAVWRLLKVLTQHGGHSQKQINVLTFYNGQRTLISNRLASAKLADVDVVSVDSMQGREVDIVILSCVRTGQGGLGFLSDWRRVNVALSRARESIFVIGAEDVLRTDERWTKVLDGFLQFDEFESLRTRYTKDILAGSMKPPVVEDDGADEPESEDEDEWAKRDDDVLSDWDASDDETPSKVELPEGDADDWEDLA